MPPSPSWTARSKRAEDRIGSISSQNFFANVHVDFPSRSRLTPYVGFGGGLGLIALDYGDLWARNPKPDAIGTAAGLPNELEIRRTLAATTTSKQAELHDRLTGYQVLGGVDRAFHPDGGGRPARARQRPLPGHRSGVARGRALNAAVRAPGGGESFCDRGCRKHDG